MSETPYEKPSIDFDSVKETAKQALQNPPAPEFVHVKNTALEFYKNNKQTCHRVALVGFALFLHKRAVGKAVVKALENAPTKTVTTIPTMREVLSELQANPALRYIPHGGGVVHLPVTKDLVLTMAGDFEGMTNTEIDQAAIRQLMKLI